MSKNDSANSTPFDLERLRELVEMMETHGLTEVSLQRGDEKWRLRRGPQEVMQMVPPPPYAHGGGANPVQAAPAPTAESPIAEPGEKSTEICSPTVGTFYSSPNPDDPPFVSVGTKVEPDTIVCIVEAMKVFNQIPAEISGTIVDILVSNGDPVEFGQPLFRVRPD